MIAKYDETLLDPAAPVLQAADFTFGNCEWPYAEEMGDTHPVEAHLNDDVEGEDLFIPGDPEAVRLKGRKGFNRSEEHTSELQSLMRNSYAVFCLQKKKKT